MPVPCVPTLAIEASKETAAHSVAANFSRLDQRVLCMTSVNSTNKADPVK